MARKSSWKTVRILLTLLVCAFAVLPAAAVDICHNGWDDYAKGTVYASNGYAAKALAEKKCQSYWSDPTSYSAAGSHAVISSEGGEKYSYWCWRCKDFPWTPILIPFEDASDIARAAYPGVVIGASRDEIALEEDMIVRVYDFDIQQADGIVRVCVDTQTGEIVAAPPADAGDQ